MTCESHVWFRDSSTGCEAADAIRNHLWVSETRRLSQDAAQPMGLPLSIMASASTTVFSDSPSLWEIKHQNLLSIWNVSLSPRKRYFWDSACKATLITRHSARKSKSGERPAGVSVWQIFAWTPAPQFPSWVISERLLNLLDLLVPNLQKQEMIWISLGCESIKFATEWHPTKQWGGQGVGASNVDL